MMGFVVSLLWVAILLVGVPWRSRVAMKRLGATLPPRGRLYSRTAIGLWWLGLVTCAVDYATGWWGLHRLAVVPSPRPFVGWTLGTLAACLVVAILFLIGMRRRGLRESEMLRQMLPRTPREKLAFTGVSITAGLVEEYVYRGFCLSTLAYATRSTPLAVALVMLGFGLGHGYQSRLGMLRATVLGGLLAVPLLATGSLLPGVLAHAATDIFGGYVSTPLRRRWGLLDDTVSAPIP